MSSIESLLSDLKAVVKFVQIKYSKAVFARIYGRKGKEMNRLNLEFSFPVIFLVLDKSIHESIIQTQLKVSIHYHLDPDTNEGEFKLCRKSFTVHFAYLCHCFGVWKKNIQIDYYQGYN